MAQLAQTLALRDRTFFSTLPGLWRAGLRNPCRPASEIPKVRRSSKSRCTLLPSNRGKIPKLDLPYPGLTSLNGRHTQLAGRRFPQSPREIVYPSFPRDNTPKARPPLVEKQLHLQILRSDWSRQQTQQIIKLLRYISCSCPQARIKKFEYLEKLFTAIRSPRSTLEECEACISGVAGGGKVTAELAYNCPCKLGVEEDDPQCGAEIPLRRNSVTLFGHEFRCWWAFCHRWPKSWLPITAKPLRHSAFAFRLIPGRGFWPSRERWPHRNRVQAHFCRDMHGNSNMFMIDRWSTILLKANCASPLPRPPT